MMATGPAASKEAAIAEIDRPERAGYARVLDFVNAFAPDPKTINDATVAILLAGLASTPAECDRYRETLRRIVEGIKVPETEAESGFLSTAVQKAAPMVTALTTNVRTAPPIVKCVRVGKSYPGKVFRLSEISFEARLQTITAVVGRNGSGKTTLFNIIAGQKQHNWGQVYFPGLGMNGTELDWRELHLRIAYVPQELPRWRGSLRDNIQYGAALHGLIGNENARETAFMIERLGLGDFVGHSWGALSSGYKLRFALARALVWKPKLLLLDEPLANLDFETQQLLMRDLRHLADSARYPIAVILSSQHLHEIEPFIDQVMFLEKGMCKFCAPLDFLAARDREALFEFNVGASLAELHQVFRDFPVADLSYQGANYLLRAPGAVKAAQVLDQLARFGVQVNYFRNLGQSIKSLFLK